MLKSLESESAMILLVTLMCWEYRYTLLLTSVQPNHCATVSWPLLFTGSKDDLCIHPRELEISVKARKCTPCPSCWIVIYIETDEARKYRSFSVNTPCYSGGMYKLHDMPLSLYPMIPYPQASNHSVTVGVVKNMLFIGTPLSITHWRIFIYRYRSCLCQDWSHCGPHFFNLFRRWRSRSRK